MFLGHTCYVDNFVYLYATQFGIVSFYPNNNCHKTWQQIKWTMYVYHMYIRMEDF